MLVKYILLIEDFLNKERSTEEFERCYLAIVKDEKYMFTGRDDIYHVIGELFGDIDAYCGDPTIANYDSHDPFCDIDETELRKRAAEALEKLKKFQELL